MSSMEIHRRKGFAELDLKAISQLNWTSGLHSICNVMQGNESSNKLMEKLGFVYLNIVYGVDPCPCHICNFWNLNSEPGTK